MSKLPAEINLLRKLKTLLICSFFPITLPLTLGHLNRLEYLEANEHSILHSILSLYPSREPEITIPQYLFPTYGQDIHCSWVRLPSLDILTHPKFPKESYDIGRIKTKKIACWSWASDCELIARVILKINQNPIKQIQANHRTNQILSSLKGSRGIVKKYFDVLTISGKKVWKIISYEKEYNFRNLSRCLETITLNLKQKHQIATCLFEGLSNMHAREIYHRNLHPDHVLLHAEEGETGTMEAALTGFSDSWLGRDTPNKRKFYYNSFHPNYAAPEIAACYQRHILPKKDLLASADSWALGLILYYLWTNGDHPLEMPFDNGPKQEEYLLRVAENKSPSSPPAPFDKPANKNSFEFIIWKLLQFDSQSRFAIANAWLQFQKISILEKGT